MEFIAEIHPESKKEEVVGKQWCVDHQAYTQVLNQFYENDKARNAFRTEVVLIDDVEYLVKRQVRHDISIEKL